MLNQKITKIIIPTYTIAYRQYEINTGFFSEIFDLVHVVRVIGIALGKKIELWIAQFILTNTRFEFRPISCYETSGFIDDI